MSDHDTTLAPIVTLIDLLRIVTVFCIGLNLASAVGSIPVLVAALVAGSALATFAAFGFRASVAAVGAVALGIGCAWMCRTAADNDYLLILAGGAISGSMWLLGYPRRNCEAGDLAMAACAVICTGLTVWLVFALSMVALMSNWPDTRQNISSLALLIGTICFLVAAPLVLRAIWFVAVRHTRLTRSDVAQEKS